MHNYPIFEEFSGADFIPYQERDPLVVYVGGITVIRGIKEMVKAVELIPANWGVKLILAGKFSPPALENDVSSMAGWSNVEYLGWQSREKSPIIKQSSYRIGAAAPYLKLHECLPY